MAFKKQRKSISPAVSFEVEVKLSTKEHEIVTQSDDEHLEVQHDCSNLPSDQGQQQVTAPEEDGCKGITSSNPNYMEISEHRKQLNQVTYDQGESSDIKCLRTKNP